MRQDKSESEKTIYKLVNTINLVRKCSYLSENKPLQAIARMPNLYERLFSQLSSLFASIIASPASLSVTLTSNGTSPWCLLTTSMLQTSAEFK
jgi:hypothetical protein